MKKLILTFLAVIFISTHANAQWMQYDGPAGGDIHCIAVNGNNVYMGVADYPQGSGGVYYSSNYGRNWTQTSLKNLNVYSLAVSGNNIFAGLSLIHI